MNALRVAALAGLGAVVSHERARRIPDESEHFCFNAEALYSIKAKPARPAICLIDRRCIERKPTISLDLDRPVSLP
jgi:hypothetical protein